jgi:S-formylglutathione hydrolase FrmB
MDEAKVPNKLIVKPGGSHGWPNMQNDMPAVCDWFDEYLLNRSPTTQSTTKP